MTTITLPSTVTGTVREAESVTDAARAFEGAGFPVRKGFAGVDLARTDPFLMLDHMGPVDYRPGEAKGAPDHPHRGFETVTYLLDGVMEHRDSHGGGGTIGPGDTQWMTAGAGLIHSEMPADWMLRRGGRMHGVQLWVNLPRTLKRTPPRYQLIEADSLTVLRDEGSRVTVRLIAGDLAGAHGPGSTHTPIAYAHATLAAGARLDVPWDPEFNALVYVLAGSGTVGEERRPVREGQLAVLGRGDRVMVDAADGLDILLLGGTAIREPIAWYGPFVMNTRAELIEAVDDYNAGRFGAPGGS
jgi:hypothetical protein